MPTEYLERDTFPKLLLRHAEERGGHAAIREKNRGIWRTMTWRDLADEAHALAAALSARGLQRGAHVALLGDNRPRRSEEPTSELQSLLRISYAALCLKKKTKSSCSYKCTKQTQCI